MNMLANRSDYYNGNPNIKKSGVAYNYSEDEIKEYIKCSENPTYFIKKYVKIISLDDGLVTFNMRDYQERMIEAYHENRFCVTLTSRQTGKSITVAAYILHYILFNSETTTVILANKAATAREILSRIKRMFENLPSFLQTGVKEYNKGSIILANDSTLIAAATSSDSIRGLSVNCVIGSTKITICDDYNRIFHINIENADSPKYKYDSNIDLYRSSDMYYTVYRIVNTINNKEYIGYHQTNNLEDGYMGSGKLIKLAIAKYGIDNFKKTIIEVFDNRIDAEDLERLLVNEDYVLNELTYNIALGGNIRSMVGKNNPFYGKTHSKEVRDIISNKATGRNITELDDIIINEVRYNSVTNAKLELCITSGEISKLLIIDGNGYVDSIKQDRLIEFQQKLQARKLHNRVAQSIICKNRFTGVRKSTETKIKISKSLTGMKKTPEHIAKINNNPIKISKTANTHRGMKRSNQAKVNMSNAKRGKTPHNKGKVYCYDPDTLETKLCLANQVEDGWVRGYVPKELR